MAMERRDSWRYFQRLAPGRYSVDLFTARTRRADESFIPLWKTERCSIVAAG
jgi:hypothetical protein